MHVIVGVSDVKVTNDSTKTLVTYALGSCVGLSLYDPIARVGGLIHCMLPLSKIDPGRAKERPAMFVDTGVLALLQEMFKLKATKENLIACVAGAASPLDIEGAVNIGERNVAVLRKLLWKNDLLIAADDVGGTIARTMSLTMSSGVTSLKAQGKVWDMNPGHRVVA